ncbi:MAG: DUF4214 domain-containing protein [Acidimicrobiales bacterium]
MTFWRKAAAAAAVATLGVGLSAGPASAAFPDQPFTATFCEGDTDSVARLYAAALGRDPELGGFQFWVEEYAAGSWTLPRMAQFFVESPEFQTKYGALTDRAFVEQLYRNVHQREGDPAGVDFWVAEMSNGMSRATVLLRFSESPENVANTGSSAPTLGYYNEGRTTGAFYCGPDLTPYLLDGAGFSHFYAYQTSLTPQPWGDHQCFGPLNTPTPHVAISHLATTEQIVEHELHHFATELGAQRHLEQIEAMIQSCLGYWLSSDGGSMSVHDGGSPGIGDESVDVLYRFLLPEQDPFAINHSVSRVGNVVSLVTFYGEGDASDDNTQAIERRIVDALRQGGF